MDTTICQPWAGDRNVVTYENTTYTGQRKSGRPYHHWASYADKCCRVTGETGCVHVENRRVGQRLLRIIGIRSVDDMLNFDFGAFFRDRLPQLFQHVDLQQYGKVLSNKRTGERRHKSRVDERTLLDGRTFRYSRDGSRGALAYHVFSLHHRKQSRSLQQFIKTVGRDPRFVTPIDTSRMLARIRDADESHTLY
jgi:hypothetical protein